MACAFRIGWRALFSCALVLAVLLIPLAHSAHFHEGGGDGDASVSATCAVCQVAGGYVAASAERTDLAAPVRPGTIPVAVSAPVFRAPVLSSNAQRAPPGSLS